MRCESKIGPSIQDLTEKLQAIKDALKEKIQSLPPNPRIKELGHGCFTVKSEDLMCGLSWSASYHHFRRQYEEVSNLVDRTEPKNLIPQLTECLDKGSIRMSTYTFKLHPDVVNHVRGLL